MPADEIAGPPGRSEAVHIADFLQIGDCHSLRALRHTRPQLMERHHAHAAAALAVEVGTAVAAAEVDMPAGEAAAVLVVEADRMVSPAAEAAGMPPAAEEAGMPAAEEVYMFVVPVAADTLAAEKADTPVVEVDILAAEEVVTAAAGVLEPSSSTCPSTPTRCVPPRLHATQPRRISRFQQHDALSLCNRSANFA